MSFRCILQHVVLFLFFVKVNSSDIKEYTFNIELDKRIVGHSEDIAIHTVSSILHSARNCAAQHACCCASFDTKTRSCSLNSQCFPKLEQRSDSTMITKVLSEGVEITCITASFHQERRFAHLTIATGYLDSRWLSGTQIISMSHGMKEQLRTVNPRDCSDVPADSTSGTYRIHPNNSDAIDVYCDMETDGGGWTVLQRRQDGTVNFTRNWHQYKLGFGDVNNEHWLGNDNIHTLTSQGSYKLRIDLKNVYGWPGYEVYDVFRVGDEASQYLLDINGYSGNARGDMGYHNNMKFTTTDVDNDLLADSNCAAIRRGGWWYNSCVKGDLNGIYGSLIIDSYSPLRFIYK